MRVVQPAPRRVRALWSVPLPPSPPPPSPTWRLPFKPLHRCSMPAPGSVGQLRTHQSVRAAADAAGAPRRRAGEKLDPQSPPRLLEPAAVNQRRREKTRKSSRARARWRSVGACAAHLARAACPRSNPLPSLSLALRLSFERVWRRRLGRGRDGIVGAARGRDERRGAAARRRARRHVARRAAQDAHQLRLRPAARGRRAARQPGGGGRRLGGRGKARQDGAIRARGEDGAWEREEGQRGGAAGREEEGPRAASARVASPPPPPAPRARPSRRSGRL